jgi:predicted phage terminase large subunit-like protein
MDWRAIYVDTAQKIKERNDYTVLQCWGRTRMGKAVLIDQVRGRFEAPELEATTRAFWRKHLKAISPELAPLRKIKIEDKVSGTGLIQALRRGPHAIPVVAVQRNRDKYMRALDVLPHCAAGNVLLPRNDSEEHPWVPEFERELAQFDGEGNSGFDDQVDAMMDALEDILGNAKQIIQSTISGHS